MSRLLRILPVRIALATTCCLVVAAVLVLGRWRPPSRVPPRAGHSVTPASLSNKDCRDCHPDVWQEWERSGHSKAWANVNVQAAFRFFGYDRKCLSCHAAEPVQWDLSSDQPVSLRQEDRDSGVNCLTCHDLANDLGVAAVRHVAEAPCRPVQTVELSKSRICGACHDAIYDDWQASRYARENKSCQSCHMPTVGEAGRRGHVFLGGHDAATVRSGARMICRQEGDELVVAITNHATGHNFPGERHNRVLLIEVIQREETGKIALSRQTLVKGVTPFRGETTAEQIKAGATFEARFPVVDPPVEADVRLLYRLFPWYTDEQSLEVHRELIPLTAP